MSHVVLKGSNSRNPMTAPCVECNRPVTAYNGVWCLVRIDGDTKDRWRAAHECCLSTALALRAAQQPPAKPEVEKLSPGAVIRAPQLPPTDHAVAALRREVRALWVVAALALVLAGTQAASAAAAVLVKLLEALR